MNNDEDHAEHIDIEDGGGCAEAWEAISEALHGDGDGEEE